MYLAITFIVNIPEYNNTANTNPDVNITVNANTLIDIHHIFLLQHFALIFEQHNSQLLSLIIQNLIRVLTAFIKLHL